MSAGRGIGEGAMAVLVPGMSVWLAANQACRFAVIGSSQERIVQAPEDWEAQRMGGVPGDNEFIPLPPTLFTPPGLMS